jgi:hypothetical protein
MLLTNRAVLFGLGVIALVVLIVLWTAPSQWAATAAVFVGAGGLIVLGAMGLARLRRPMREPEPANIEDISDERAMELMRITGRMLAEMNYRYSVRLDLDTTRRRFDATINEVKLGFIPVLLIDHITEKTGFGYVAFVHDGERFRAPGLPCPDGEDAAVRHAVRSVNPIGEHDRAEDDAAADDPRDDDDADHDEGDGAPA